MHCPSCGTLAVEGARFCSNCGQALPQPGLQTKTIDYRAFAAERTKGFVGRDWVFQAAETWLTDHAQPRFFLLTGEPGSGKTALAAQLYRHGLGEVTSSLPPNFLSAVHFCRAGDTQQVSPVKFAESLGLQLANRYPAFAQALAEKSSQGKVTLQAQQQVDTNYGMVVGNYINLSVGDIQPQDAFLRVVREPLEVLLTQQPAERVIMLVDALDEALSFDGKTNIATLLLEVEHLSANVRLIVTSRPDNQTLPKLRRLGATELSLSEGSGLVNSQNDVADYLRQALTGHSTLNLSPELSLEQFIQAVLQSKEVNFLYLHHLLKMLEHQPITLAALQALPKDLDEIYQKFLERLAAPTDPAWRNEYKPILGTLAVAREALTKGQLSRMVGIQPDDLGPVLVPLRQFLDEDANHQYGLYHRTFAEFLLDENKAGNYWCMASSQHLRIANRYDPKNLSAWDDYGKRHVAAHLAEAIQGWEPTEPSERQQLTQRLVGLVLDRNFQQLRDDLLALQGDLEAALRCAASSPDPLDPAALLLLVRSSLGLVEFRQTSLQPEPIFDLAKQGKLDEAERRLGMFNPDPDWYQAILLNLAWLAVENNPEKAKALRERIAPHLMPKDSLPLLIHRLDAALNLAHGLPALLPLNQNLHPEQMNAILTRMGGTDADPELLQSFLGPPPSSELVAGNSYSGELVGEVDFLALADGEKLVGYAWHHRQEAQQGNHYLRKYLDLHASYSYDYYRNRSLSVLLHWVLQYPEQDWALEWLSELSKLALRGSSPQYREGLHLTLLGLRAKLQMPQAEAEFQTVRGDALKAVPSAIEAAESSETRGLGDSWGYLRRRLVALAQVDAMVLSQSPEKLLDAALAPLGGFAGFRVPAMLVVAEGIQLMWGGPVQSALEEALKAAHNVQEARFCAVSTSRVNALLKHWWPGPTDWKGVVERFVQEPGSAEFSALHTIVDDDQDPYPHRKRGSYKLPLRPEEEHPRTLKMLADIYQRPLGEFQRLNPMWQPQETLPPGTEVEVPDPGFATWLALRFSAGVLGDATLSNTQKAKLLQGLVPLATPNPTILDGVLSRLLLVVQPDDPKVLEELQKLAPPLEEPPDTSSVNIPA